MMTAIKLFAAAALALAVLNPGGRIPRADTCECKAKAGLQNAWMTPRADTCECKAKKTP